MDRRERNAGSSDALLAALLGHQAGIWTALPGIVKVFHKDPAKGICVDVQPAIKMLYRSSKGVEEWLDVPMLLDCPVIFPGGGGLTLTFPIIAGDECLVVFASRCIDAWYESGGSGNQQAELRMHDLSDGFAFVGVRSKPHTLNPQVSGVAAEIRSDDGNTKISVRTDGKVQVVAPTEITLTAPLVTINAATTHLTGDLNVDGAGNFGGNVTAPDVTLTTGPNAPVNMSTHRHHIAGAGDTDPPKP